MGNFIASITAILATAPLLLLFLDLYFEEKPGGQKAKTAMTIVAVFAILYAVANGVIYKIGEDAAQQPYRPATFLEAQSASGFTSGYE